MSDRDYAVAPVDLATPKDKISPSAAIGMADPTDEPEPHKDAMEGAGVINSHPTDMRCCCGKEECVFLRHNCSVLLSVERDVHVAAKMGQVCLGLSLHSLFLPK